MPGRQHRNRKRSLQPSEPLLSVVTSRPRGATAGILEPGLQVELLSLQWRELCGCQPDGTLTDRGAAGGACEKTSVEEQGTG